MDDAMLIFQRALRNADLAHAADVNGFRAFNSNSVSEESYIFNVERYLSK